MGKEKATGGCLCGKVRYEIEGPLRDVINCHCSKCRRFTGHVGAYTRVKRENLALVEEDALKWYRSVKDETPDVYRGFCSECGSSLFWDARGTDWVAVTAGSLDDTKGLKTMGHIWLDQAGDYYQVADNLPKFSFRWGE